MCIDFRAPSYVLVNGHHCPRVWAFLFSLNISPFCDSFYYSKNVRIIKKTCKIFQNICDSFSDSINIKRKKKTCKIFQNICDSFSDSRNLKRKKKTCKIF